MMQLVSIECMHCHQAFKGSVDTKEDAEVQCPHCGQDHTTHPFVIKDFTLKQADTFDVVKRYNYNQGKAKEFMVPGQLFWDYKISKNQLKLFAE